MGTHQTPEMEAESSTPIHLLEPGFSHKPVNITVGRVAIRHFLHVSDFPLHSSKSVAAVDFIIWDAQVDFGALLHFFVEHHFLIRIVDS